MSMGIQKPKFCMECGASLPEAAKFCAECGTKVPLPPQSSAPGDTGPNSGALPAAPLSIPPELKAKFEAAQNELRGDRREVVVLFADLKGFTSMSEQMDPEEVSLVMQRLLSDLADAVHRYEGYVDKYIGDAIMALFGAPIAHENDAERAVLSALEMLQVVGRRNESAPHLLSLRVGLNLGDVVAADIGSEGRVQYTVMGDTVNVASRLEGAAEPDSVLISHSVYERIANRFDTEEVPPVTVKGKSEPLQAHRVLGLRAAIDVRGPQRTAFVGREKELATLEAFLDRIAAGDGQVLLIEAEAGAGKSRLIAEGIARSAAEEAVFEVGFTQIKIPGQLSPAIDLFRRIVTRRLDESATSVIERASEILGEQSDAHRLGVLGLASQAFPDMFAGGVPTEAADPRAARQNRWIALAALIGAFSQRQPTVIVIEDVHWADEEGQEFLAYLIPVLARRPVGFILTARVEGRPGWLSPDTTTLQLEALGEDAALSIVGGILDTLRPSARREIIRRSQGNPLYLEELARSLSETVDKSVRSVPGTVQGLLQSRMDRLESPVRLAIQMASVLGPQFSVGLLHRMYALDPQPVDFELALSSLEDQAFIEPTEQLGMRRFRHALMQEVAYGGILSRFRKVLHESAAQLGEEHYAERLEAEAPFFAHHYWEADLHERAAPHLFRAAMSAAAQYDLYAAERWFGQLSTVQAEHPDILPDAPDRALMLLRYGAVLLDRGNYDLADDLFARLGDLGMQLREQDWVVQALRYRGQIAALRGRIDESRRLFEKGLEEVSGAGEQIVADLRTGLGLALYFSSDANAAVVEFQQALRLYEQVEDLLGQAKCYINIGNVLDDLQHDREAAEPSYEKALALIEQVGDRRLKTGVLLNLATLAMERGDWEDALARLRHIETLAEETGWSFMRFLSLQNQASCDLPMGRLAMALDKLDTCLREGENMLKAPDRVLIRELQFEAYLSALDTERAAERLAEAESVAKEIDHDQMVDGLLLNHGRLLVSRGEWSAALRKFSEATESAVKLGHPSIELLARAHHYRAAAREGLQDIEPPSTAQIDQRPTRVVVSYLVADADAEAPTSDAALRLEEAGKSAEELGNLALERAAFERAAEVWETLGNEEARGAALHRAALAMNSLEALLPPELRDSFTAHPRNEGLRTLVHT